MRTHARWRSTLHCTLNCRVEPDPAGETALGETYNVTYLFPFDTEPDTPSWEVARPDTARPEIGGVQQWCGRYLDRFAKRADEWRISGRVCVHEGPGVLRGPPV